VIRMLRVVPALALAATIGLMATTSGVSSAATKIVIGKVEKPPSGNVTETGSSLMYPLWNVWAPAYEQLFSGVTIQTASTGSGTGITNALNGTTNIGASDAYLSSSNLAATPTALNIPLAISSQIVEYNIPGITAHLNLSGKIIAAIYKGQITNWSDQQITALNPGITIPSTPIVTLHRSDSSGDTFIFTQYLSSADPAGWGTSPGYNTTVTWPNAPGALGESGNAGMVAGCKATVGCISYVGISYLTQVLQNGQGYAALGNEAGKYVLPTPASIVAESSAAVNAPSLNGGKTQAVSLVYLPNVPLGYPIVNYEYAIVNGKQTSATTATAIRSLLEWALAPALGNNAQYLAQVNFQPLPPKIAAQSLAQVLQIKAS
jgi:phosphate transport system substrate-binding protein